MREDDDAIEMTSHICVKKERREGRTEVDYMEEETRVNKGINKEGVDV